MEEEGRHRRGRHGPMWPRNAGSHRDGGSPSPEPRGPSERRPAAAWISAPVCSPTKWGEDGAGQTAVKTVHTKMQSVRATPRSPRCPRPPRAFLALQNPPCGRKDFKPKMTDSPGPAVTSFLMRTTIIAATAQAARRHALSPPLCVVSSSFSKGLRKLSRLSEKTPLTPGLTVPPCQPHSRTKNLAVQ